MGRFDRRRAIWWTGLGLVVAGLAVLGWVAWQFWGTNWVSQRTHDRIVDQVEQEWNKEIGPTERATRVHVPEGEVLALVRIPRFGDDYVVPVLAGVGDTALSSGYGHFSDSAEPGEVGNFALAAHRVTHGEPLRNMPSLKVGDEIIIETREATYTYQLTTGGNDLEVPFTAGWVLADVPTNPQAGGVQPVQEPGQKLITLTTCSELFHTDNRLVAFGELIGEQPRT
ncbi:class E sortase [Nocardioides sp. AE5]|uniref:class E sortase n=1 Tax=Nocardioides sp. AE5 TaxID=2962573 RepID=UPI002881D10D|nr:class E sortase [Nocardioides sp. AE5]MDT0200336.1 class E sortase [Nocardioides sp. AE5]